MVFLSCVCVCVCMCVCVTEKEREREIYVCVCKLGFLVDILPTKSEHFPTLNIKKDLFYYFKQALQLNKLVFYRTDDSSTNSF